jgi:hypothetical protein
MVDRVKIPMIKRILAILSYLSTTKKPQVQQDVATSKNTANAKWPTDQRFIDALSSHINSKPRPPRGQYDYTDIEITRLIGFVNNLPDGYPSSHGLELFCCEDTEFSHVHEALHDFDLADVFALYADAIERHDLDRINENLSTDRRAALVGKLNDRTSRPTKHHLELNWHQLNATARLTHAVNQHFALTYDWINAPDPKPQVEPLVMPEIVKTTPPKQYVDRPETGSLFRAAYPSIGMRLNFMPYSQMDELELNFFRFAALLAWIGYDEVESFFNVETCDDVLGSNTIGLLRELGAEDIAGTLYDFAVALLDGTPPDNMLASDIEGHFSLALSEINAEDRIKQLAEAYADKYYPWKVS